MLRKILLPTLAIAALAGCATDYAYRGGNGDYYYGQPRVEYRYHDPYGYYPPYGGYGYGGGYYYDRFGRLVYASPYGGYYGYPYGGGWWYTPRPQHDHDRDHDHDHPGQDGESSNRRPPWRNLGAAPAPGRGDALPSIRRPQAPSAMPMPQRDPRPLAPREQRMGSPDAGGSRMGRVIRRAKASDAGADE